MLFLFFIIKPTWSWWQNNGMFNLFPCVYLREIEKGNLYTCNIDMTNSFSLPEHEKDSVINCYKLILKTVTPLICANLSCYACDSYVKTMTKILRGCQDNVFTCYINTKVSGLNIFDYIFLNTTCEQIWHTINIDIELERKHLKHL